MAKAFGIITAFLIAISAFLAFKNKQAHERNIAETAVQKQNLAKSTERFNIAVGNVNQTTEAIAKTEAETAELNKQSAERKKINDDLKLQSENKTAQVNSNKEKLDEVREKTAEVGNLRELATEMRQVTADLEDLSQSITAAEAKLANLTSENNQAESLATSIRTRLDTYAAGRSLPTLKTHIRSIYPTWGFVTLAAGNNAGVVTNSTLHVVRDEQVIARLLVTAVESNSSSASIIPDSVAQDVTLMVGDRVVAAPAPDAARN